MTAPLYRSALCALIGVRDTISDRELENIFRTVEGCVAEAKRRQIQKLFAEAAK